MAWSGGGGNMFGGVQGSVGAARGFGAARPEGLPFAGIPPEISDAVDKLLVTEPDHGEPDITFSHRVSDRQPLTMRRLLAAHMPAVWLCALVVVVEVASLQSGPYLTQLGIDRGILKHNLGALVAVGITYLGLIVIGGLASALRMALCGRLSAWISNDMRLRVFAHLQRLSLDFFTDTKAGVVMTRMTSDIEALQQLLQDGLVQFLVQGLTMIFVAAITIAYSELVGFDPTTPDRLA